MKNVTMRKSYTPAFKTKVAIELVKGEKTMQEICKQYEIHPTQAAKWKKQLEAGAENIFGSESHSEIQLQQKDELIEKLYKELGQRTVELEWLKKKLGINQ